MLKNGQARLRKVRSNLGLSQNHLPSISMPELSNLRHERFCQLFVALGNASEAYRQAGYRSKSPDVDAAQLLVKGSISSRITELRVQSQRKIALTREDALELLAEIITTPAGAINKHHRLCESFKETADEVVIRMPSKIAAMQELCRILGWHAADRVEVHAGDSLNKYIVALRARPIGGEVIELESNERRLDEPPLS
jgi:phage terminase small subunit